MQTAQRPGARTGSRSSKPILNRMPGRRFVALAILAAVSAGGAPFSYGSQQKDAFIPGQVLVQFSEEALPQAVGAKTGLADFDRIAARFGVQEVAQAFPSIEAAAAARQISDKAQQLRRVYDVRYSEPFDPVLVAEELGRLPAVVHAEPRVTYRLSWDDELSNASLVEPNDPGFRRQTHFDNLRMTEAWDVARGESGGVVIAIVDGGTDWNHPDLKENAWTNPGEIAGNGVDDDANGYIDDVRGWNFANSSADPKGLPNTPENAAHGTWVAGAAAAVTNNALGIAGTGWNARYMALNASCSQGDLLCHTTDGVVYAAMNGADLITASWGSSTESTFLKMAVEMALEEGALVVAASGNEAANVDAQAHYPAAYGATLSVGGTRKNSDRNVFNYGRSVNVFAPALQIDATAPGDAYAQKSGTSLAVPLVAGIAALVKTANPNFSPHQIRERIRLTSDSIEDVNPQEFSGLLGRGRVNAHRAVTESTPPGVRLEAWEWVDSDENSDLRSLEAVRVTAVFTNYGSDATALTVGLESPSQYVDFGRATEVVGALAQGASHTATFEFTLASNTPDNYQALVYTTVNSGEFEDGPDILRFSVNEVNVATHSTGALVASITNEGNVGYVEFQGDSNGRGFRVRDRSGQQRDLLFEGGLLLGTGPDNVSDCVRAVDVGPNTSQHKDLILKPGTSLLVSSPGQLTSQQGRVELVDTEASNPLGVTIVQESYVDSAPEHEDYMVLKYTITNTDEEAVLSNLHVGLFFDWDVNAQGASRDIAKFNDSRMVGYVLDGTDPTVLAGVKVLTGHAGISYEAISNPEVVYTSTPDGGFSEQEKWAFLSGGIGTTMIGPTDVSQLMGTGPFSLLPMQSVVVAFAVIGGSSEADLLQNADNAQELWDSVLNVERTYVESEVGNPGGYSFDPVFPNPASADRTLQFRLPAASDVELAIYNLLGQKLGTIVGGNRPAGSHRVHWDGRDSGGRSVACGVYVARLTARGPGGEFRDSQPLVVLR